MKEEKVVQVEGKLFSGFRYSVQDWDAKGKIYFAANESKNTFKKIENESDYKRLIFPVFTTLSNRGGKNDENG